MTGFMNIDFNDIINFKTLSIILTLILTVISFGIIFLLCTTKYEEPKINAQIIFPDSSITLDNKDVLNRQKSFLISTLLERESNESNYINSQDNIISQARNIFMVLFGVLLGIIISNWDKKERIYLLIVLLFFLTLIFLLLDVHIADLKLRSSASKSNTARTVDSLVNQNPNELLTHKLDYKNIVSVWDSLNHTSRQRKLYKIGNPDGDQIIFFYLPLALLYLSGFIIFIAVIKNGNKGN